MLDESCHLNLILEKSKVVNQLCFVACSLFTLLTDFFISMTSMTNVIIFSLKRLTISAYSTSVQIKSKQI